ncbi:MAG TPA: FxLYD domain-containing protein [Candidatus Acidoferrum sp.]|nr:FxLYD domain-containing protein [Candidatus Acidoferrum sp.]
MRFKTLAFACVLVAGAAAVAHGAALLTPLVVDGERYFTLEWQAADTNGRPVVHGRIRNEYGFSARKVRLLVNSLDAAGAVIAQTIAYVPLEVPPGTGAYFEARLPARAASYRVSIFQWEWVQSGGGDTVR